MLAYYYITIDGQIFDTSSDCLAYIRYVIGNDVPVAELFKASTWQYKKVYLGGRQPVYFRPYGFHTLK